MPRLAFPTALLMAAALTVPARTAEATIEGVEIGFGGAYKAGEWTPLSLRLSGPLPPGTVVETLTADPDGTLVRRTGPLSATGESAVQSVFQTGRLGSDITLRLLSSDGAPLAERRERAGSPALPAAVRADLPLWVTLGGFAAPGANGKPPLPLPEEVARAAPAGSPPTDPLAYSAADLLFVRSDLAPSPEQAEAIRLWVAGGGHLAVALGRFTDEYRAGPFAKWVPIEVGGTSQLLNLASLEEYSRSRQRGLSRHARVRAAQLTGAAESFPGDVPLIARSPYGFGRVTLFAIDLDVPPFSNWPGLPAVLRRALMEETAAPPPNRAAIAGVTDLSSQLLRAQETFPGTGRVTTSFALWSLVIYAVVAGLVDYLLVHRLFRRPALTWVTLPLIVAGAAWWLNGSAVAANGTASRFNQLDLIDLDADPATGTFRGRTAVTLYAADSSRADLAVAPQPTAGTDETNAAPRLAWSAPPESTFGGTLRETAGGALRSEYDLPLPTDAATASHVPLLVWSARHFEAEWQQSGAASAFDLNLTGDGRGRLEGRATHRLPGPIKDYYLVYGDRVYMPREPEWHPNEPIEPSSSAFLPNDLGSFLARRQITQREQKPGQGGEKFIVSQTAYDPLATDLDAVVRTLTFHRAAGGRAYTGLTNLPLATDDLTPLLRLGRAILVGRLDAPAADVKITPAAGASFEPARRTTYVRLVLPVRRTETAATFLPPRTP